MFPGGGITSGAAALLRCSRQKVKAATHTRTPRGGAHSTCKQHFGKVRAAPRHPLPGSKHLSVYIWKKGEANRRRQKNQRALEGGPPHTHGQKLTLANKATRLALSSQMRWCFFFLLVREYIHNDSSQAKPGLFLAATKNANFASIRLRKMTLAWFGQMLTAPEGHTATDTAS